MVTAPVPDATVDPEDMPLPTLLRMLVVTVLWAAASVPAVAWADDPQGAWPLDPVPVVVAPFDPPSSAFGAGHRGVDLAARPGAWVRAALPGRVSFAGVIAGRGVVVVDHGATRTTYEPVAAIAHVGDVVGTGQVLGLLEVAGSHCAPAACLHWGWIRGSTYLDPLRLVGGAPVIRLLPWSGPPVGTPGRSIEPLGWASLLTRWFQALGCAC